MRVQVDALGEGHRPVSRSVSRLAPTSLRFAPMRLARVLLLAVVIALGIAVVFGGATPALAQTTTAPPYPGTPTTVSSAPSSQTIDLGSKPLGSAQDVTECNFAPGTAITVVVNGTALSTHPTADVQGCVVLHIEVLPTLVALGRSPVRMLAATGLAAVANNVQVRVDGELVTVGPPGSVVTVVSSGTGINGSARSVSVRFTVVASSGGLIRTGAAIVKWAVLGVLLLGVGALLVLAARRRSHAHSTASQ